MQLYTHTHYDVIIKMCDNIHIYPTHGKGLKRNTSKVNIFSVSWMVMSQENKCLILSLSYVYNFKNIDVNCKVHITIRYFISTVFFCFAYFMCMFFLVCL